MKLLFSFLLLSIVASSALSFSFKPQSRIPNQYIGVFYPEVTAAQRRQILDQFISASESHKTIAVWDFANFRGFSIKSTASYAFQLSQSPLLKSFSPDVTIQIDQADECHLQRNATWGINRVSERKPLIEGIYDFEDTGLGVDAYIIDTGIRITHDEFKTPNGGSRAIWGANFADDENRDCNGHGTHVAGTVGGSTYGIAKNVTLIAVKVFECSGSGSSTSVISGINWAAQQKAARGRPSVANMSLGGLFEQTINDAVTNLISTGVVVAVSAGNVNGDSCERSPASTPDALTTGATQMSTDSTGQKIDRRSSFSCYGPCVKLFAPGSSITSAGITSDSASRVLSGTSMATPHVCGASALYLSKFPKATPQEVRAALTSVSTPNLLDLDCDDSICEQSPNKLLYSGCRNSN